MEDIIIDERFRQLQTTFMEEHYREFDDSEENKFSYTDIFRAYNTLLENFIQESLIQRLPNFSMADFIRQLQMRRDELDGEVFEILLSFSDFLAFKEAILDFKSAKEGRTVDLSSGISITSSNHGVPSMDELCNNSPGSFN
ncbi:PREDICTED: ADP-ribosylation factor-like protein 2-binding protein isoform X2 [Priapulus caudatus]|nr:PREDICTED: ADP-ribosylation factor-like protein 2-binding protein isoform X2 [Priapulus caudatus]